MTIPRQLHLHAPNHTPILQLYQTPVQELNTLRNKHYTLKHSTTVKVKQGQQQLVQQRLGFQGGKTFEFHTVLRVTEQLPTEVKFHIRSTPDKSEGLVFGVKVKSTYPADEICDKPRGNTVYSDRRHAGIVDFHQHFPSIQTICLPLLNGNLIELHFFVDNSSVEAFIADGLLTVTESFFPTPNKDNHYFFMEVVEGEIEVVKMNLWVQDLSKIQSAQMHFKGDHKH